MPLWTGLTEKIRNAKMSENANFTPQEIIGITPSLFVRVFPLGKN